MPKIDTDTSKRTETEVIKVVTIYAVKPARIEAEPIFNRCPH